ncbi:RNA polymerase sigma factor [Gilvimarinus sp. SDUM040013]|uniref:RNA polymerase sigma factor n=1 Tax=Gilvimarinus gilvus TaxID=3058038 RepID=A0ABU4RX82_9GAMM|nr:RNA polymerase sigma factor [Gilvimarinus sp. SDUM040013]MDO3386619.1 RNA polymerase sigma factor [Gilvimarinus sp. SDUM040013]MDX6849494.1 RNA polymerase sigma factor [Gilvimarinus sp. SDUM040013]
MNIDIEALLRSQSGRIRAIANRYARGPDCEDLYQEILEQLWRARDSFRAESKVETWVYRIALNTAITGVRKQCRQREVNNHPKAHSVVSEAAPAERCQADILERFAASLDEVDRSILLMYLDGLSGAEMAAVLGMQRSAIQTRISRLKTDFSHQFVEEAS